MIGKTVSHYRITDKLGEGGMGVVFLAHDTSLDRRVALKFLPDAFADDPERLARFEREAKLLASLNHPNIATIHGLEQSEGIRFLVLELVEGPTLADRIRKGRIPVDETLDICRQISEGLEAAHEKGIIHRDLKPANVKITPEGKVKILDFGLAKAFHEEPSAANLTNSPTVTDQMTHPGVILGTAAYMSPEQAKGKVVDKRTDIWAFGCVLYECLTGKRAFQGDTVTEIVASILKSEPDWALLPAETPAMVRSLLRRCLQKEASRRLHDIADGRIEMLEGLSEPTEKIPSAQRFPHAWVLFIGSAALVVGVLMGLAAMKYLSPSALPLAQPVVRFPVRLEPGNWLYDIRIPGGLQLPSRTAMALSSDSRFLVYSAIKENPGPQDRPRLYLRRLDQLEAKPISGTEGGISPFLSPDDRWVGFWAGGKLMKVPVEGGVPTPLCDVIFPFSFSWGAGNQIYFSEVESGLLRVSADGGKAETLTKPNPAKEEYSHRLPFALPGGKGLLFTIVKNYTDLNPRQAVLDLATQKWRVLLEDAADGRYANTGHLVFLRRGTLMAASFDLDRMEVTGQPVSIIAGIAQALNVGQRANNTAAGQFSVSASGSLVYAPGGVMPDIQGTLVWVDRQGKAEVIPSFKVPFFAPRLSPDGKWIAYRTLGMEQQLWVYDLNRGTATRITSEGSASWVAWTPDSRRLIFSWQMSGQYNLYWQSADGSSSMERLTTSEFTQFAGSLSQDGQTLALVERNPGNGDDIMLLSMRDRKITPFLNARFSESYPEFSPDGRWMAYVSNESGRNEVYIQPFPGPGGKTQVSNEGGVEPLWSQDGRQLFYRRTNQVWVVDVQTGVAFSAGKPRMLFEQTGYAASTPIRGWDISQDGKRFLMVKYEERKPQPVAEMILVQNWFEELKRLVPVGNK